MKIFRPGTVFAGFPAGYPEFGLNCRNLAPFADLLIALFAKTLPPAMGT